MSTKWHGAHTRGDQKVAPGALASAVPASGSLPFCLSSAPLLVLKPPLPFLRCVTPSYAFEMCNSFFLGAPKSLQMVAAALKLNDACCLEEKL